MNPGSPTVPWVAWDEASGGVDQIFVSRLVGGTHFELANHGAPISVSANPSTRPDISFSGNTPYVSWREDTGGAVDEGFVGHFVNAADPTFVLDQANVPLAPPVQADVREPISSTCTADPFNQDGAACQGGAIGTPFFLSTGAIGSRLALFGNAYQSGAPTTGEASTAGSGSVTVSGSVNPEGAPVTVRFEYGTSTAYGQSTNPQALGAATSETPFSATLSGLPADATIHYRAVVSTDFGSLVGADRTLSPSPAASQPGTATTQTQTAARAKPRLGLAIAEESLGKLLRTGKLSVTATVDEGAKIVLTGAVKVKLRQPGKGHHHARASKAKTKLLPVFTRRP